VSRVDAVYFDLYGTLLDLGPLDAACEAVAPGRGAEFARAWRVEQLRLTWLRTIMDAWVDFEQVTQAALLATATRLSVDPNKAWAALGGAFDRLPVRPEAGPTIDALRAAGLRTGILSNGSRAMLERALAEKPLAAAFDDVLSVDAVRRYKPDAAVYDLAVQASGLAPGAIGFVTANDWDAAGAAAFGFRVAWLRPAGSVPAPAVGGPEPIVATWAEIPMFAVDPRRE
jgi:2-haloacid dehalogenase